MPLSQPSPLKGRGLKDFGIFDYIIELKGKNLMSVAIRLSRGGSKKRPYYKVVVSNSRAPRDGKYLEQVGTYNPLLAKDDVARVRLIEDRVRYWIGVGAQPTDRVARMLDKAGIKERARHQ